MIDKTSRKYDILLLGATGYTGSLVAEHISANLPTNLRWAISGTSLTKLKRLAEKLRRGFVDRLQPCMFMLTDQPSIVLYHSPAGEQVVRACVENGTDYVDCAAIPELQQTWIRKYHDIAEKNGTALIHGCGALITPLDLIVWLLARDIREKWSTRIRDVTLRLDELDTNLSGGTIRTVISHASLSPSRLKQHNKTPTIKRGVHHHPILGWLASSSVTADQDRAQIYRTWGLLQPNYYGADFSFDEYEKADSWFGGLGLLLQSFVIGIIVSLARIPLLKILMLWAAPKSGGGPDIETARKVPVSMEAVAVADDDDEEGGEAERSRYAHAKFLYPGGHYPVSALFMAQAAASLLFCRRLEGGIKGGCLTPAVLGQDFVDRTESVGVQWMVESREGW
ncbi:hypothetical protein GGS20DRAFT_575068 [Poronia punctata]|nr:hypothetical protein GGS20DRAFT_575068 [Poronia punctata]